MSAAQHTPGPWKTSATTAYWIIYDPDSKPVATTLGPKLNKHAKSEANARLIASAPELLEFAQEVRRSGDTRLASMALAVIAKATGQKGGAA